MTNHTTTSVNKDEVINEYSFLGSTYNALFVFFISMTIVTVIFGLYYYRKYDKTDDKSVVINRVIIGIITLFVPVGWIGLTIGSVVTTDLGDLELGHYINLGLTLGISIIYIFVILMFIYNVLNYQVKSVSISNKSVSDSKKVNEFE